MDDLAVFGSGLPALEQDFSWLLSMPDQPLPSATASAPLPPPFASTSTSPLEPLSPPTELPARRQKSCQACRLRRVKCERPTGSNDCTACMARGFRCVRFSSMPDLATSLTRGCSLQLPTDACSSAQESCCYPRRQEDRPGEVSSSCPLDTADPPCPTQRADPSLATYRALFGGASKNDAA